MTSFAFGLIITLSLLEDEEGAFERFFFPDIIAARLDNDGEQRRRQG